MTQPPSGGPAEPPAGGPPAEDSTQAGSPRLPDGEPAPGAAAEPPAAQRPAAGPPAPTSPLGMPVPGRPYTGEPTAPLGMPFPGYVQPAPPGTGPGQPAGPNFPPPPGAPPGYPPYGTPPKKRRGLLIASISLGIVLLLCGGGGTAAFLLLRNSETGEGAAEPVAAVDDFLTAVYTDKDVAEAESLVCSESRDEAAIGKKVDEVKKYATVYQSPRFKWTPPKVDDQNADRAIVSTRLTMTTADEKTADQELKFTVIQKTGWWVCEVA